MRNHFLFNLQKEHKVHILGCSFFYRKYCVVLWIVVRCKEVHESRLNKLLPFGVYEALGLTLWLHLGGVFKTKDSNHWLLCATQGVRFVLVDHLPTDEIFLDNMLPERTKSPPAFLSLHIGSYPTKWSLLSPHPQPNPAQDFPTSWPPQVTPWKGICSTRKYKTNSN